MIQATEGNRSSWDHSTAENAGCAAPGLLCGGPLRSAPLLVSSLIVDAEDFLRRQRGRVGLVWASAPSLEEPLSLCCPRSSGQHGFQVWLTLRWLPAPRLAHMDLLPLRASLSSSVQWGQQYHRQACNWDMWWELRAVPDMQEVPCNWCACVFLCTCVIYICIYDKYTCVWVYFLIW